MRLLHVLFILALSPVVATAQLDSLGIELYITTPGTSPSFDLSTQVGFKIGKKSKAVRYSLGYSYFSKYNQWLHLYDERRDRWTNSLLILTRHTDSTPAFIRSGRVSTASSGISIGISSEWTNSLFTIYAGVQATAYVNRIDLTEWTARAHISAEENHQNSGVFILYTDYRETENSVFYSVVPTLHLASGLVFTMSKRLKLIPQLNLGIFQVDSRIYSGTRYGRQNKVKADFRPALQLSLLL